MWKQLYPNMLTYHISHENNDVCGSDTMLANPTYPIAVFSCTSKKASALGCGQQEKLGCRCQAWQTCKHTNHIERVQLTELWIPNNTLFKLEICKNQQPKNCRVTATT
jgi:hypothetical protein